MVDNHLDWIWIGLVLGFGIRKHRWYGKPSSYYESHGGRDVVELVRSNQLIILSTINVERDTALDCSPCVVFNYFLVL